VKRSELNGGRWELLWSEILRVRTFSRKHPIITCNIVTAALIGIPWLIFVQYRDLIIWWTTTIWVTLFSAVFIGAITEIGIHGLMRFKSGKVPNVCADNKQICIHFKVSALIVGLVLIIVILLANPSKW